MHMQPSQYLDNFEQLTQRYKGVINFHVARMCKNSSYCDEDDVRQLILIKLHKCMELYNSNSGVKFFSYFNTALWKSLGNGVYAMRKCCGGDEAQDTPYTYKAQDTPEAILIDKTIPEVLNQLKVKHKGKALLYDRIFMGYGWAELGRKYGMTRQGAENYYSRNIDKLKAVCDGL